MEHQGRILPAAARHHFADEQHMIACAMLCMVPALEPRHASDDERGARIAEPEFDPFEAIGVRPGKPSRELHLVVRQHVDRVVLGFFECGEACCGAVQAPDDEWRLEG